MLQKSDVFTIGFQVWPRTAQVPPKRDALTTVSTVWVRHGPERPSCHVQMHGEKKKFDYSVITPATTRGFAYGFFFGHLRDVLLW